MQNTKFILLFLVLLFLIGCHNQHNSKDNSDNAINDSISNEDSKMEKSNLETYKYDLAESDDKNLCLFSRENEHSGTMANYDNIIQFESNGNSQSFKGTINDYIKKERDGFGTYYSNIYTIKTDQMMVYLVEYFNRMQTADVGYTITAYIMANDEIKKFDFFHKQGKKNSSLSIECHWCDHERLFYYDKNEKVLYVPIADNNYAYDCTIDKYDKYELRNNVMEYTKTVGKRYWLHSSLRDFEPSSSGVTKQFDTENYHIRLDELGNGNIRYASWAVGTPTTEKPDLVITNGKELDWGHYVFQNGEYKYTCIFDTSESMTFYGLLTVEKNGKIVLEDIILR